MPITVECPACEQIFRISSKYRNRKGRCPLCDSSFIADENVITAVNESLTSAPKKSSKPSIPVPSALKTGKPTLAPPSPKALADSEQEIEVGSELESDISANDKSFTGAAEQSLVAQEIAVRKPVSNLMIVLFGASLLVISAGIAFGFAYATKRPPVAVNEDSDDEDKTDVSQKKDQVVVVPEKKDKEEIKPAIHEDEMPKSLSLDKLHGVWSKANPFIVRLDIATTSGNITTSGVIIDSRGWIATSYSGIKNAVTVRTTIAAGSLSDGPAIRSDKTDAAKGIIASDPAHDIAIIAANRSLVASVSDIETEAERSIVGSQQLIVCRSPEKDRRLWITDARVDRRANKSELGEVNLPAIKRFGYEVDDDFEWIVYRKPFRNQLAGSAILNKQGQLIAMGIMWKTGSQESFAVPIGKVLALRDKISADPTLQTIKAFPKHGAALASAKPSEDKVDPAAKGRPALNPNANDFEMFQTLNKALDDCKEFGWVASTKDEAQKLVAMADLFASFPQRISEMDGSDEEKKEANSRFMGIFESVQKELDGIESLPEDDIKKSNELVLELTDGKKGKPICMICQVFKPSIFSPEIGGQKTVMFQAEGTEQILITTASENHFEFRPRTRWMVLGHVNDRPNLSVRLANQDKISCLRTNIKMVFEIID